MKEIALLTTICAIVIMQLTWALAIDLLPATNQTMESRQLQVDTQLNKSHSSPPPEAVSFVERQNQWQDTRRPIWNMAHMVNSIKELDYRLG